MAGDSRNATTPDNPEPKKVFVLSDHQAFFDIIKLNLATPTVRVLNHKENHGADNPELADLDLILVISSTTSHEPVISLFNASLIQHVGLIPLLIVSDRKFEPSVNGNIHHLDFPFDARHLRNKVCQLLGIQNTKKNP